MVQQIFKYLIQFVLLALVQVLILNELQLLEYGTPMVYPLLILTLPINTPRLLTMLLAFNLGLAIDAFSNTAGMHAFALVLVAYLRPVFLRAMTPRDGYDPDDRPTIYGLGFQWFIVYAFMGIILHHVVFYSWEIFNFSYVGYLLLRTGVSAVLSMVLIIAIQFIFYTRPSRKLL